MTLGTVPSVLDLSLYISELGTRTKEETLADLVTLAQRAGVVRGPQLLLNLLAERECLGNTGIGKGVALPHARSLTVIRPQVLVARSRRGIEWGAPDGIPVTLILLALTPGDWSEEAHHALLAREASVARLQRKRQRLLEATCFADVAGVLGALAP